MSLFTRASEMSSFAITAEVSADTRGVYDAPQMSVFALQGRPPTEILLPPGKPAKDFLRPPVNVKFVICQKQMVDASCNNPTVLVRWVEANG